MKVKLITVISIIFLTCVVVFAPIAINASSDNALVNKNEQWSYSAANNKITESEFAHYYCNRGFSKAASVYDEENSVYPSHDTNFSANKILEKVFSANESVYNTLKSIISDTAVHYSKMGVLTVVNESPIVFNIINIVYESKNSTVELVYEEKTQTLISFYYYCMVSEDTYQKAELAAYKDEIEKLSKAYYTDRLALGDNNHYFESKVLYDEDFKTYNCNIVFGLSESVAFTSEKIIQE